MYDLVKELESRRAQYEELIHKISEQLIPKDKSRMYRDFNSLISPYNINEGSTNDESLYTNSYHKNPGSLVVYDTANATGNYAPESLIRQPLSSSSQSLSSLPGYHNGKLYNKVSSKNIPENARGTTMGRRKKHGRYTCFYYQSPK